MRYRSSVVARRLLAVGLLLSVAAPAQAAETSNSEFVIIREGDVLADDLYAGAIRVVVEGEIDGDLIAFAAEEVVIAGTVTGSVIAVAPRVTVSGAVGGSLRVSTRVLSVTGEVGRDVVGAMFEGTLSGSSSVGGDVLVWAWSADVLGAVGHDLSGSQRTLRLAGSIEGDVDVSVGSLTVVEKLTVAGDLGYRSARDAVGLELADAVGVIVHKIPLAPNLRVRALGLLGRFLVVVFLTVAALAVSYGWRRQTEAAVAAVGRRPLRSWLGGASILFSPLIAIAATALLLGLAPSAAAFPLLAILAPVILALIGIAVALALVAGAPVAGWVGAALFKRLDFYGAMLAGSIVTGLVWHIPWVGWLVPVLVLPLGLGGWIEGRRQLGRAEAAS